jgi:hypothetical protein
MVPGSIQTLEVVRSTDVEQVGLLQGQDPRLLASENDLDNPCPLKIPDGRVPNRIFESTQRILT